MLADFVSRGLLTLAICAAGLSIYWLINRLILDRAGRQRRGLENLHPGIPAILYFTTPNCAPCRTRQRPALQELQARLGNEGLQVIEVDAAAQPALADYWGVLSVPTTFIIDTFGRPRRVNHGVQGTLALLKQIQEVELNRTLIFSELNEDI